MSTIRQKTFKASKHQPPLHRNPPFPKGYKDPFPGAFSTNPVCGITSRATNKEIKNDARLITKSPYYKLNESAVTTDSVNTVKTPASTSSIKSSLPANTHEKGITGALYDEELEIMVTRLIDAVSLALAPTVFSSPHTHKATKPSKAKLAGVKKPRSPLGARNVNVISRVKSRKSRKPIALRGAGGKLFINRERYRSSAAVPRAALAQTVETL